MKKILFAFAIIALAFTGFIQKQEPVNNVSPDEMVMEKSFYDFKMKDINGQEVDFSQFKGKKLLLVNVASKCGYTKQYEDLQKLHQEHGDEVTIIGFPANNFGGQEPGTNEEIKEFCSSKFGVTFMMMDKISVKGDD